MASTEPSTTSALEGPTVNGQTAKNASTPTTEPRANGQAQQKPKRPAAELKTAGAPEGSEEKLSGAELKKLKQAEKAARRAMEKGLKDASPSTPLTRKQSADKAPQKPGDAGAPKHHKRTGSAVGGKSLPIRQGSSQNVPKDAAAEGKQRKKVDDKRVAVFEHLYGQPRRTSIAGAGKEVHPAVLALGLQLRDYEICGSNARCVAMLLVFKRVISSYTTPLGTSLSRNFQTYLSHQISYLSTCRPLSISQGNAIRWLKLVISTIDPDVPEPDAKRLLRESINSFIRERFLLADQIIADTAANKIQDSDVILTYAKSSIIEKTLLAAHKRGKKFRTIVVDSRPLFEGKNMARTLAREGMEVQYTLTHAISHAVKSSSKVLLGAHAMMSNGRLYSRVGTALVAMMAKERHDIPVIVCCETVKFTDRVALDSIVVNEIGDPDELVETPPIETLTSTESARAPAPLVNNGKGAETNDQEEGEEKKGKKHGLEGWRDVPNLQLLNLMHDVTPAEYVDMVITEMGSLPPTAVPVVHRMSTNQ